MFEHLSDPFPMSKQLNRVARYVSKIYPELDLEEYWRTYPSLSNASYHIQYGRYTIGVLHQDVHTNEVFLVLNTSIKPVEYELENKVLKMGTDLVVKYLECVPLLRVGTGIIFKVTREDIPNV